VAKLAYMSEIKFRLLKAIGWRFTDTVLALLCLELVWVFLILRQTYFYQGAILYEAYERFNQHLIQLGVPSYRG